MSKIKLETVSYNDCTIGRLCIGEFQCFTLELPWVNNITSISCIPEGTYEYFYRESPKNGHVIELKDVPKRTFIQIHSGNYTRQIEGCILVGDSVRFLDADSIPDVTNSSNTLGQLMLLAGKSGQIEVKRHAINEC